MEDNENTTRTEEIYALMLTFHLQNIKNKMEKGKRTRTHTYGSNRE